MAIYATVSGTSWEIRRFPWPLLWPWRSFRSKHHRYVNKIRTRRHAPERARRVSALRGKMLCTVLCLLQSDPDIPMAFQSVQVQGAERIARLSSIEGVERLVHISAIGANTNSESISARTKGEGEKSVLKAFPNSVILRPSIVFGVEDGFFNRFAAMSRISPVLPLIGADTSFQPVYVDDVALAASSAALEEVPNGIYELGGPDIETFRKLIERMLKVVRRKTLIEKIELKAKEAAAAKGKKK